MLIFRATSLKYCYLHVLNFYLDNGVMTTPKRRILLFVFTVLSFKYCYIVRQLTTGYQNLVFERVKKLTPQMVYFSEHRLYEITTVRFEITATPQCKLFFTAIPHY